MNNRIALMTIALVFVATNATLAAPCDPAYVQVQHKTVKVQPTGGDDTANLQCAFDIGATLGPGATVQLSEGTFTTEQLVVNNFRGVIRGVGQATTIIRNPDYRMPIDNPCNPGGSCFADAAPSAQNRYPALVSVLGTDVALSDFTIEIVGTQLTELWSMWGFPIQALSGVLQFYGSHARLHIERVKMISGGLAPDAEGYWGGTSTSMAMWTFSRPWFVTGSSLVVRDSTFHGGGGIYAYNLDESTVKVADSRFELLAYSGGLVLSDMRNSQFMASHNEFVALGDGVMSALLWPGNIGTGIVSSWLLFDNNTFGGDVAIQTDPNTFHEGVTCQAVNNNVSQVAGQQPYVFSPGATCKVVGNVGPKP